MFQRTQQGAVDVISGDTPLSAEHVETLATVLDPCLLQGQPHVVLDLYGVLLIDSSGLELLLDVHDTCQQRGGDLKLASPNPLVRDILSVTGVDQHFTIYPDTSAAVGSFV